MFGAQRPPQQQQSLVSNALLERMKMGFMTGCLVGGTTGFLYGTFSVFKFGHGGMGAMPFIARAMLTGGGSFGVFLAIGSAIRAH